LVGGSSDGGDGSGDNKVVKAAAAARGAAQPFQRIHSHLLERKVVSLTYIAASHPYLALNFKRE